MGKTTDITLDTESGRYSPEKTAEVRKAAIRQAIRANKHLYVRSKERIDINDIEALERTALSYVDGCDAAGLPPNLEGLCCACGFSRQWLYQFLREHPKSESAKYLDSLRLGWASLRLSLAESKQLDPATVIFALKNSGIGFSDRQEVELVQSDPLQGLDAEGARRRLIEGIPVEDDEE